MNIFDKILSWLFKKYTKKIYRRGYIDGYNNRRLNKYARLYKGCTAKTY